MESTVAERVARERGPDGQCLVRSAIWLKQLDEVRRLGLAFSRGELDSALNAISAPIFGKQSQIMGAITIAAPAPRLLTTAESSYAKVLRQAAANISMELGCVEYPFSLKRSLAMTTTKGDHGPDRQRR
jgi:DNA-binding IclR family transcriptional regulator